MTLWAVIMARICHEVSKRLSKPHIIVSLCYSLAKRAKFNRKFTFLSNSNGVPIHFNKFISWTVSKLIVFLSKLHFSDFCGYGPFGLRREKQ
jgi:hypothetical protein